MIKIMTINDQIRDEKLQYDVNREAAKISASSSSKIDEYEYLTGEETIPSDQKQLIEQIRFQCNPLGKALEKQTKTIEDQGEKKVKAIEEHSKQLLKSNEIEEHRKIGTIKDVIPEDKISEDEKKELNEIIEIEKTIDGKNLIYKTKNKSYSFKNFRTIRSFGEDIYNSKITIDEANQKQSLLLEYIVNFDNKSREKNKDDKK